ncbi:MAG: T9SS type A sorting domain-containing protein [Ignavibacterium sp.]|nr:MAG: T9SS type A sorting domain-containing protein [Ignavibacterium sp.]
MKKYLLAILVMIYCGLISAQTTLSTGDIAFTTINTEGNLTAAPFDYFSIVALVPIASGTQIRFSDVQYLDASGFQAANGTSEFEFVWTAPAGGIAYMEQVTFWATGTVSPPTPNTDKGTVTGDGLTLTIAGDQIFAVQGASMNSGTILAAIHSNYVSSTTDASNWDNGTGASTSNSELPNVLTNGVNAVWIYDTGPVEVDNAIFNACGSVSTSNTAAVNREVINNVANWSKDDTNAFSTPPCGSVLPVELSSFSVSIQEGNVFSNWETATEVNNYGFEIERCKTQDVRSETWEKIGFVNGHGNSNSPKYYSFVDGKAPIGELKYRLKQIDFDGTFEYSDFVTIYNSQDYKFDLAQNYPNPFNPSTTISFTVPNVVDAFNASTTLLKVYDVLGREVASLVNEKKTPGNYKINFNANKFASGMYFYTLTSGSFKQTKKMLLIK